MPPLTLSIHHDVTMMPCLRDRTSRSGYSFGVFGPDGRSIEAFDHPWCAHRSREPAGQGLSGDVIYGGLLMNHFGHFLMEAMSRLWFIQSNPHLPVIWHTIELPVPHTPWKGWMQEAWQILGLGDRQNHFIRRPMRFAKVLLPQSGLVAANQIHPLQAKALARVSATDGGVGPLVWLSRSGLPGQFGRIAGESEMEAELSALGWSVVRPESIPVAAQAALFASAEVIAGFAGSAFHAVLLTASPRARMLIVERPSVARGYYEAVAAARGVQQAFLAVPLEAPPGPINAWTTFQLANPSAAAQIIAAAGEDLCAEVL